MLPASLIARLGIPLLLEALAPSLRKLPEGKGNSAADALDALRQTLDSRQDASELKQAHRHLEEVLALRLKHETTLLSEVNRSLRVEAQSQDAYVRRWRPTFGYAVAAAWVVQTCALTWVWSSARIRRMQFSVPPLNLPLCGESPFQSWVSELSNARTTKLWQAELLCHLRWEC